MEIIVCVVLFIALLAVVFFDTRKQRSPKGLKIPTMPASPPVAVEVKAARTETYREPAEVKKAPSLSVHTVPEDESARKFHQGSTCLEAAESAIMCDTELSDDDLSSIYFVSRFRFELERGEYYDKALDTYNEYSIVLVLFCYKVTCDDAGKRIISDPHYVLMSGIDRVLKGTKIGYAG